MYYLNVLSLVFHIDFLRSLYVVLQSWQSKINVPECVEENVLELSKMLNTHTGVLGGHASMFCLNSIAWVISELANQTLVPNKYLTHKQLIEINKSSICKIKQIYYCANPLHTKRWCSLLHQKFTFMLLTENAHDRKAKLFLESKDQSRLKYLPECQKHNYFPLWL